MPARSPGENSTDARPCCLLTLSRSSLEILHLLYESTAGSSFTLWWNVRWFVFHLPNLPLLSRKHRTGVCGAKQSLALYHLCLKQIQGYDKTLRPQIALSGAAIRGHTICAKAWNNVPKSSPGAASKACRQILSLLHRKALHTSLALAVVLEISAIGNIHQHV